MDAIRAAQEGFLNTQPSPDLARIGDQELRQRILELTKKEAKERGICKSTLHDLRRHATNPKPFRIYNKVAGRLLERCREFEERPA